MKTIEPLNPMPDGTCRTLKYQYQKNGIANFIREGSYAATGVIEIEDENESSDRVGQHCPHRELE